MLHQSTHKVTSLLSITAADQSHPEDRVVNDLGVCVVAKLGERVEDVELGVGDGCEGESKRNRSPHRDITIAILRKKMRQCLRC